MRTKQFATIDFICDQTYPFFAGDENEIATFSSDWGKTKVRKIYLHHHCVSIEGTFKRGGMISWSRPDPDLPDFEKLRKPDLLISTFFQIKKSWSSNLDFLISTWSRPDLERINGQLFSPMNKGRKSSNLMKSIREKIILLQYVHEFLKLLGKRLCLFDMSFYKFAKRLYLYKSLFPLGSFINIHFDDNYLSQ